MTLPPDFGKRPELYVLSHTLRQIVSAPRDFQIQLRCSPCQSEEACFHRMTSVLYPIFPSRSSSNSSCSLTGKGNWFFALNRGAPGPAGKCNRRANFGSKAETDG